ncbi:hypothetical protein GCM10010277_11850 [Streptomyces longisporoflavus]|nr:hypothetical protein GCM10010277_11850 [Streptomyces longisporoflavus]
MRCRARVKAVADSSATSTLAAPQLCNTVSPAADTTSARSTTGPLDPSMVRSERTSSCRTACGLNEATAMSIGSAARNACAASRVDMSRMVTRTSCWTTRPASGRAAKAIRMTVSSRSRDRPDRPAPAGHPQLHRLAARRPLRVTYAGDRYR